MEKMRAIVFTTDVAREVVALYYNDNSDNFQNFRVHIAWHATKQSILVFFDLTTSFKNF